MGKPSPQNGPENYCGNYLSMVNEGRPRGLHLLTLVFMYSFLVGLSSFFLLGFLSVYKF